MNTLVLVSGGIDSTACVDFFQRRGDQVHGLFVDYGQAARVQEAEAVMKMSNHYSIPVEMVVLDSRSEFLTGEIMGRNLFLLATGLMLYPFTSGGLALGIHSGTHYYDCSSGFIMAANQIVTEYSSGTIQLVAPFVDISKPNVYKYAVANSIPIELTYSCELGVVPPCGQCLSCQDRNDLIAS